MKRPLWIALTLALVTAAVLVDIPTHQFLSWDDPGTLWQNAYFNPPSLGGVLHFWRHAHMDLYIPVTYTVWGALAAIAYQPGASPDGAHLNPAIFHGASLLVHVLSVLAVFALLRRLFRADWPAAAGALLFGIHPVQVETVAWASGLKDALSGLFSVVALWQYVCFVQDGRKRHYALAIGAFVLALLSKPAAMTLPLAVLALDRAVLRRSWREALQGAGPWLCISVPFAVLTKLMQPAGGHQQAVPLWSRPFVAGDALAFYLGKLFWPVSLAPDYGRTPEWVLSHGWAYAMWLIPAAVFLLAWRYRERFPWLLAGCGISVAAVLPVLGLVPFDFQHFSTVSDHYLYVAMLGPALILAALLSRPVPRPAYAIVGVVLCALGMLSAFQSVHWANNEALFSHTVEVNPRSWMAYDSLGLALVRLGKLREGIEMYRRGLVIDPPDAKTHRNLADALDDAGQTEAAIAEYRVTLQLDPANAGARNNLAVTLANHRRFDEAVHELEEAVRLRPDLAEAHLNLGNMYGQLGRQPDAAREYQEALRLQPDMEAARRKLSDLTGAASPP